MAIMPAFPKIYQRAKNIIHAVQAFLIFVAAMITIAIFTKESQSDTRITYYFALCLLCIPFIIYQTAFPTFQRSKRFANAYAHASIDIILTQLWFAAFIGEIVWAKDGTEAGKGFKSGDGICSVFGWGPTDTCHLGQVTMVFGIIIFLLFALTSAFSVYGVRYFRAHGVLPGNKDPKDSERPQSDDLEFNGTSPHTYDQLAGQQKMQQHHVETRDDGYVSPIHSHEEEEEEEEVNATLPPRPAYPKAPQLPPYQRFEPVDISYHGARPQESRPYNPGPSPYQNFTHASSDYALPSQRPAQTGGLPTLRVDTTLNHGPAGGNLHFPVANYSR